MPDRYPKWSPSVLGSYVIVEIVKELWRVPQRTFTAYRYPIRHLVLVDDEVLMVADLTKPIVGMQEKFKILGVIERVPTLIWYEDILLVTVDTLNQLLALGAKRFPKTGGGDLLRKVIVSNEPTLVPFV